MVGQSHQLQSKCLLRELLKVSYLKDSDRFSRAWLKEKLIMIWRLSWVIQFQLSATRPWQSIKSLRFQIDMKRLGKAFVIYQGHHGDAGAHRADVILPGAAYTEKPGTYVNTEGRVQLGMRAAYAPGQAKEDWAILRALSGHLGKALPYDTLDQVRSRLIVVNKVFAALDQQASGAWGDFGKAGPVTDAPFVSPIANFYMTDPISRASKTMADCMASRTQLLAAE